MRNALIVVVALFTVGCAQFNVQQTHELGLTGAGQALTRVTADPVEELRPAISPDGKVLLFDTFVRSYSFGGGGQAAPNTERTIIGVDPSGNSGRTMYTATTSYAAEPAWMPDGSAIVYSSNSLGKWGLVRSLSNSPNSAVAVVVNGDMAPLASRPSLSPDGKRVGFCTAIRNTWQLATSALDGSSFTILGEGMMPAWSPDGKRLAFVRTVGGFNHIFVVNADTGTNLTQLTSGESIDEYPAWSPDGKEIVFASNRGWNSKPGGTERTRNLFVIRADGSNLVQLTDGDGESSAPAWGRDGWIYFSSDQAGNFDIWRFKVAGEIAHRS